MKHVCILAVVSGKQRRWLGVSRQALGCIALTLGAVAQTYFQEALQHYATMAVS